MEGRLPLPEAIKLNEFLANMLKSKQSRLTKKMKNAKLSSKTFKRTTGHLTDVLEAREFSECEDGFFHSIQNGLERAEIKFHMQKEWRETFSTYCVSHGQPLNVDRWLVSLEEMERRVHRAKDEERLHRRKMMMGHALRQDMMNPDRGVVIEQSNAAVASGAGGAHQQNANQYQGAGGGHVAAPDSMVASSSINELSSSATPLNDTSSFQSMASPFLHKMMAYIHRHNIPFEYIDTWVPSFVPDNSSDAVTQQQPGGGEDNKDGEKQPQCRLCFAGSVAAKQVIIGDAISGQARRAVPLSADDQFNLSAFGDYSESFSFDVGCGLPGRVYHMGVPTWEQSVHNAPLHHFERVGGSQQWGIRTVVGIPVPSPNVGRIVVVLYSRHDRAKDHDMVIRLTEEFTRLLPSPKWKLVVDCGQQQQGQQQQVAAPTQTSAVAASNSASVGVQQQQQAMQQHGQQPQQPQPQQQQQNMDIQMQQQQQQQSIAPPAPAPDDPAVLTSEVISIFGEHMPSDPSSPSFTYLEGFMSLRLLLLRSSRTDAEQDVVNTILSSYSSYKAGGRTRPDIALMLARDFLFLKQSMQPQQQVATQQMQTMQQQPNNTGQFLQQTFAPAPSQMFSQATNLNLSAGTTPDLSIPPPSGGGNVNLENGHGNDTSALLQQQQNLIQDQLALQQAAQLASQPQQYPQGDGANNDQLGVQQVAQNTEPQQEHIQTDDANNLMSSLGDLASMQQDNAMMVTTTSSTAAAGDGEGSGEPSAAAAGS